MISQIENIADFIIESIDTGVLVLDKEFRIVRWNAGMERLTGFSRDEVLGKGYFEMFPHLEGKFRDIMVKVLETGTPHEINHYEHHTLRRGPVVINRRFYPLRDRNGEIQGLVVITEDITEKALLEEQLRRKSQKLERRVRELRTIIEITEAMQSTYRLDALLYIILTGITAGKGLGYNRAMLFLTSEDRTWLEGKMGVGPLTREEGLRIWEELHDDRRSLREMVLGYSASVEESPLNRVVREMRIPISEDQPCPLVKPLFTRRPLRWEGGTTDGYLEKLNLSKFVVLPILSYVEPLGVIVVDNIVSGEEIDEDGIETLMLFASQVAVAIEKSVLYQGLDEQIERLRQANEEMRAMQEQLLHTERLAAIGQMASSLADKIRNPVSLTGGYARLILKRMESTDERRQLVQTIIDQTDKLEELLRENLDFLQPMGLKLEEHDLLDLISTAVSLMRRECEERGIKIHLSAPEEPIRMKLDQYQMVYALMQLMRNAIQAMPEGGDLWISCSATEDGCAAKIEISDTGKGMSEEVLKRAFDPFFTTDKLRSGLGLTVVKRIIEEHGGTVQLKSRPGKGTTAIILLPLPPKKDDRNLT